MALSWPGRRFGSWLGSACSIAVLCFLGEGPLSAQEYWSVVEQAGRKVGYLRYERQEDAGKILVSEALRIRLVEGSGTRELRIDRESLARTDGTPIRLGLRVAAGATRLDVVARVDGAQLRVTRRMGDRVIRDVVPLPPSLVLRDTLERRIAGQDPRRDWLLEYDELDLASLAYVRVRIRPDAPDSPGPIVLRRSKGQAGEETSDRIEWIPQERRFLESWILWGLVFVSKPASREVAIAAAEAFDPLEGMVVASPYRIPATARAGTIRYVFESTGQGEPAFAATTEQGLRRQGRRAIVTVCHDCGHEPPPSGADLLRYRRANAWIQSDDPQIRAMARRAPLRGGLDTRMQGLSREVERHMTGAIDFVGYASALEAADSRRGDCSEYALLLAALARASGIPTRVVAGLAYASRFTGRRDVFGPHMWVQSWDGARWRSYDAALGGFDSGHVALMIGDGSPREYQSVLAGLRTLKLVEAGQLKEPAPEAR